MSGVVPAKPVLQLGNSTSEEIFYCPECRCPVVNSNYGIKRHLSIRHCNMASIGINSEGNAISSNKDDHVIVRWLGGTTTLTKFKALEGVTVYSRNQMEQAIHRSR